VVDEADLHICSKLTALDRFAKLCRESAQELFVKRNGNGGRSGADIRWTVAFFGAGEERELAHYDDFPTGFKDGAIHNRSVVRKDPEPDEFASQPFAVFS